jgi:hypothetical protein
MKTGAPDQQQRVRNKSDLLEAMRTAGIWLVDASVTALYNHGTKLVDSEDYRRVLRACWESHIRDVVCKCAPSAVLIVGKGVDSAIGDVVRQELGRGVEVVQINQPDARLTTEKIASDRRDCFDLCCRHRT